MSRSPSHLTGGIVWKNLSGSYHIAIIADDKKQDGWKLPLVKQDPYRLANSDPFEEIANIVGTDVKDPLSADTVFYPDFDPPEYAIFWHLRVKKASGKNVKKNQPDVDVRWVTPSEAVKLLTRESERKLISLSDVPSDYNEAANAGITLGYPSKNGGGKEFNTDAYRHLEGDLRAHSAILEYKIRENTLEDGSVPAWGVQASALVKMAHEQMKRGKLSQAWKSLHASKRLVIFGMPQDELNETAKRLRQEAADLNNWRKTAVHRLLGEFEQPDQQINASALYLAADIRDEHLHNVYYKNRLNKTVIKTLLYLLTATVVSIFIYMAYITYAFPVPLISFPNEIRLLQTMPTMTGVMLFGLFGGVMSAIFRVRTTSDSLKRPEILSSFFFTTIRVFTGGAAAIFIFFFLESEFYNLILPSLDLQPKTGFIYFIISFLCGFSERVLMRSVTSTRDKD